MIINLTQHAASPEQREAGVVDLPEQQREALHEALTFESVPTSMELDDRADWVSELAVFNGLGGDEEDPIPTAAMIGGAPFFMSRLEASLLGKGITPLYAFSKRDSVEEAQPDSSVIKRTVFRHLGFVSA